MEGSFCTFVLVVREASLGDSFEVSVGSFATRVVPMCLCVSGEGRMTCSSPGFEPDGENFSFAPDTCRWRSLPGFFSDGVSSGSLAGSLGEHLRQVLELSTLPNCPKAPLLTGSSPSFEAPCPASCSVVLPAGKLSFQWKQPWKKLLLVSPDKVLLAAFLRISSRARISRGNNPGCSEGRIARMSSDSVSFSHVTGMSVSCEIELCDPWDETIPDRSEALELLYPSSARPSNKRQSRGGHLRHFLTRSFRRSLHLHSSNAAFTIDLLPIIVRPQLRNAKSGADFSLIARRTHMTTHGHDTSESQHSLGRTLS
ncbi:hypothetical protein KC353_g74 [Hortaea werneckii]|nr:hypothetical protein KC353_g74 [Hortaea werneckii]